MDSKNLKVSIEKPCEKNGKYCLNYKTIVVDFNNFPIKENLKHFNFSFEIVRDKINKQYNRFFYTTTRPLSHSLAFIILIGFFLFVGPNKIYAKNQAFNEKKYVENQIDQKSINIKYRILKHDLSKNLIQGKIVDSKSKEPLKGASILIQKSVVGTITSENGDFKLAIPDNIKKKKVKLIFRYVGYDTKSMKVRLNQSSEFHTIILKKNKEK